MSSWPCSLVCLTRVNALYAHDRLLSTTLAILISSCAFQLTVDITLSFLSVMFKSLSSTIPRTPMISSIELPESSSPVMMRPISRHSSRFAAAFSTSSRSMTPAPSERPRKDSSAPSSSSRTRKTSITGGLKSFLKPRKPSPEPVQQREIAMPRPRKASRTSPVDDIEAAAVGARPPILAYTQSNSSHQGPSGWPATNNDNNVNHPPTSLNKYTFPSKPADALEASSGSYRKSRRNEAPVRPQTSMGSKPKKADRHRPGNLTDSEAPLKMTLQLKTEIPPVKRERIPLQWPLVRFSLSDKMSKFWVVMFNIIFDPVGNRPQLKRFNGDYYAEMKDEERTLTASPHCTLRKMNIRVKVDHPFIPWIVKVRRKEGIRCIDVFEAVYSCFKTTLTPDEELRYQDYLKTDWCVTAFKFRCAKSPGITYVNERQGKRRVDLLGERTFFGGLTHDGDDKWTLALESHRRFAPCYM